jgi:hypothetical protein
VEWISGSGIFALNISMHIGVSDISNGMAAEYIGWLDSSMSILGRINSRIADGGDAGAVRSKLDSCSDTVSVSDKVNSVIF